MAEINGEILRIAIIGNVIASYREGFYDRLFSREDLLVNIYCQNQVPGLNLKTIHNKYPNNVKVLNYISARRGKISWQFIPWKEVLSNYDVVFIEGNPRNISHSLLGTFMRITNRKVVLWSQGHSFRANAMTENVRLLWARIFKYIFIYTDAEVKYLRQRGFKNNYIVGMNNGLDQKIIESAILLWPEKRLKQWRYERGLENRTLFLSCARLEPKNKFQLLVQAMPAIVYREPNVLWSIIGNGPEKAELESMINNAGLSQNVRFVGEIYHEEELAPWFLSSVIFVHPAAIGLSMLHAFGYGLPVITHGNSERHNPEYAAFEAELTGRNYHEGDIQHLSETVIKLMQDKEALNKMKIYVQKIVREKYNVDVMVERFVQIAKMASYFKNNEY